MDQEVFNLELRKFLKRFGVTAQREIEKAVAAAVQNGRIRGDEVLAVNATLEIPGLLPEFHIDGQISLAGERPIGSP